MASVVQQSGRSGDLFFRPAIQDQMVPGPARLQSGRGARLQCMELSEQLTEQLEGGRIGSRVATGHELRHQDALAVVHGHRFLVGATFGGETRFDQPFEGGSILSRPFDRTHKGKNPSHPCRAVGPLDAVYAQVEFASTDDGRPVGGFQVGWKGPGA